MVLSIQLYTLRREIDADLKGTLTALREMGLEYVELAGQWQMGVETLKPILDELGLKVSGSHVSLDPMEADYAAITEAHRALGCVNLINPWCDPTYWQEKLEEFAKRMEAVGLKLKEDGFTWSFHNHAHEMHEGRMGNFLDLTSADAVQAQFDLGWVFHGGQDPVTWVKRYAGRIPTVHLKDMSDNPDSLDVLAGQGQLDFPAIVAACDEAGVGFGVVEMDEAPGDALASVKACVDYYRSLGVK